jgi:hypothetical protein
MTPTPPWSDRWKPPERPVATAPVVLPGVRFVDDRHRDRGGARTVTCRPPNFLGLTVIDVVGADHGLSEFLTCLDRKRLVVGALEGSAAMYTFRWASGYWDGVSIKVQGILEPS